MTPKAAKAATALFHMKAPTSTKNSPTKLFMPGNPTEDNAKITRNVA